MEKFIKNLARGAGKILREGFRKKFNAKQKSDHFWDVVTEYDLAAEKYITDKIKKRFSRHGILTEEGGYLQKKSSLWIIDPLDATHAFVRGLPQFSVSISFVKNQQIEFGVVYDPMDNELFFAQRKKSASRNGIKIVVSSRDDIIHSIISIIMGTAKTLQRERQIIYDNVVKYDLWPSRMESAALTGAYTACGRYDIFISKNLDPWDYSAAGLILAEAGAKVTDFRGKPYHWNSQEIVAANPILHKKVIEFTRKI